jgi:ATP-binding cassette, subfamily B, bacterial
VCLPRRWHEGDPGSTRRKLAPGTVRRVLSFARPYRGRIAVFGLCTVVSASTAIVVPLLLKVVIDDGVVPARREVVIWGALAVAAVALVSSGFRLLGRSMAARVGHGLIFDLRRQVFEHVQRQPIAFFARTQTGSLVSRLNADVVGVQQAFTGTLSLLLSNTVMLVLALCAMLVLSWQITLLVLALIPLFMLPARFVGGRLAGIAREAMQLRATMNQTMTERFQVGGALLVKTFGRHQAETAAFTASAARVRDMNIRQALYGRYYFIGMGLLGSAATAVVYGFGGWAAVNGTLQIGTLVAMAALMQRVYGPITGLSNLQIDVMTTLVSFERVFEVLELRPMVRDAPDATTLDETQLSIEFDDVWFRYPSAADVSLASLESLPSLRSGEEEDVLRGVSFRVAAGQMVALVGPSGAGKSTIVSLLLRLYDPTRGAVRVCGSDVRTLTLESLNAAIGVVSQDAHMFHDTIRANLLYPRPDATEGELLEALRAAQIDGLVASLPQGLDTVVGDRGYRLSGGEKQRLAIARLLLKQPRIVLLDEATAHLDSGSEAAVRQALKNALQGRTALVIAHRLTTIRDADLVLVVTDGRIVEHGTHDGLLAAGGTYADLYRAQFDSRAPTRG